MVYSLHRYKFSDRRVLVFDSKDIEFFTVPINDSGINFTSDLKWSAHIDVRIRKAFPRFMRLKRSLPTTLPANVKSQVYKLYILPIITYGSVLWYPNKIDLSKLEVFQNKVTRWFGPIDDYKDISPQFPSLFFAISVERVAVIRSNFSGRKDRGRTF